METVCFVWRMTNGILECTGAHTGLSDVVLMRCRRAVGLQQAVPQGVVRVPGPRMSANPRGPSARGSTQRLYRNSQRFPKGVEIGSQGGQKPP
jgi:hypothetical protein